MVQLKQLQSLGLKKIIAYKGATFSHYASGVNGAGNTYYFTHNLNKELVAAVLCVEVSDGQIFDKFMLRDGGSSTNYRAYGYQVSSQDRNNCYISAWYIDSVATNVYPVFYFKQD